LGFPKTLGTYQTCCTGLPILALQRESEELIVVRAGTYIEQLAEIDDTPCQQDQTPVLFQLLFPSSNPSPNEQITQVRTQKLSLDSDWVIRAVK